MRDAYCYYVSLVKVGAKLIYFQIQEDKKNRIKSNCAIETIVFYKNPVVVSQR